MTLLTTEQTIEALLKPDGVIAFPTDTVYGLGCLVAHDAAIERIYALKGRDRSKPLILMSHALERLLPYLGAMTMVQNDRMHQLAGAHWPGSLTLVLPKHPERVPGSMTVNMDTVGIRVPQHSELLEFFKALPGHVLATTSANRSLAPAESTAQGVIAQLGTDIDGVLGLPEQSSDRPSTVLRIESDGKETVLRQGNLVIH